MYTDNFTELLDWVKNNRLASIETITIDLGTARDNALLEVAGLTIYAADATDASASLQVRHNELESGIQTIVKNYGIVFPFYRLYLTNAAQVGKTITLTIGRASPFNVIDNRTTADTLLALQDIVDQLAGGSTGTFSTDKTVGTSAISLLAANADRKSALIQSDLANTGIIYIGFNSTVSSSKKVAAILPGGSYSVDDYAGALYAISGVAGQLVSASEV